jgi:hypothetical protein
VGDGLDREELGGKCCVVLKTRGSIVNACGRRGGSGANLELEANMASASDYVEELEELAPDAVDVVFLSASRAGCGRPWSGD